MQEDLNTIRNPNKKSSKKNRLEKTLTHHEKQYSTKYHNVNRQTEATTANGDSKLKIKQTERNQNSTEYPLQNAASTKQQSKNDRTKVIAASVSQIPQSNLVSNRQLIIDWSHSAASKQQKPRFFLRRK